MSEYAGRGDPAKTLALLWGRTEPAGRGPKPGLSVDEIVAAAIELADAEGLDAVTMRRVGERLGRSAMAIYTYLPSKHELLDLMLDRVQAELPRTHDRSEGWRAAAEAMARGWWEHYERHPWMLHVIGGRATLGPHEMDRYETALGVFDEIGLTGLEMTRAVNVLYGFVASSAKTVADTRAAERATGMSDDDWWNAREPLLVELSSTEAWAGRYPIAERLGSEEQVFDQPDRAPGDATPYLERDALDTFEFGLARLLDGIEALVATRRPRRRGR